MAIPTPKPHGELAVCVSAAKVGQHEQGLPVHRKTAPPRALFQAPRSQQAGQEAKVRAGQIEPCWVDKHAKLQADRLVLVDNPSTRSFISSVSSPTPIWLEIGQVGNGSVSVGSVADSYDNAMSEAPNGIFKTESIEMRDPGMVSARSSG